MPLPGDGVCSKVHTFEIWPATCSYLPSLGGRAPLVLLNHFLSHITLVTEWLPSTGTAVGAAPTTTSSSPIRIVRTRTIAGVAGDRLTNQLLPNLLIAFQFALGVTPCKAKG